MLMNLGQRDEPPRTLRIMRQSGVLTYVKRTVWDSESGVRIIHVPPYGNERMRKQLGWFTLLNAPYDTLEEYIEGRGESTANSSLK